MFLDIVVLRWGWGTRSRQINTSQLKYPIRGNGKIVSNLAQSFDTLCLMISSIVRMFLRNFRIIVQDMQIGVLVNFLKTSPFQAKRQLGPNLAQNYSTLYLMISHRDLFETFQHDGTQQVDKDNTGQFLMKSCFSATRQFEPHFGQN